MEIHLVHHSHVLIAPDRQRKEFDPDTITKLAESIQKNGLIHPIIVRNEGHHIFLVAGERRMKAIDYIWNFGDTFKCGPNQVDPGYIPCIYQGEMDPIDAYEMELEENVQRQDLSWQEKAKATAALMDLRRQQAVRDGKAPPTTAQLAAEIKPDMHPVAAQELTRNEVIVSRHLDDKDISGCKTLGDAFKTLKRKEELKKSAELSLSVGKTFSKADHTMLKGNCIDLLNNIPDETFDVILTDPPYGMGAQEFGNSGGKATGGAHFYDDSYNTWGALMLDFSVQAFRVAKSQAHAYVFCDIINFSALKALFITAGWKVFRTPLIWVNPSGMRAPWPEQGPQRKYQTILYAVKGNKPVTRLYSDVITSASDENLNHQAQKPIDLYVDLLRRSVQPGDSVLDAFGGTGPILPAAHAFQCRAVYMEQDESAFGIAVERLKKLA